MVQVGIATVQLNFLCVYVCMYSVCIPKILSCSLKSILYVCNYLLGSPRHMMMPFSKSASTAAANKTLLLHEVHFDIHTYMHTINI